LITYGKQLPGLAV